MTHPHLDKVINRAVTILNGEEVLGTGIFTTHSFRAAFASVGYAQVLSDPTIAWILRFARNVESLPGGVHWRVHRGFLKQVAWFFNSSECLLCSRWIPDPAPPASDPYHCHACILALRVGHKKDQ